MPDFFRVRLGVVSRSAGHSAAKRSAYQSCGLAIDHVGRRFDFSRKAAERAVPTVMLVPDGASAWCNDAASLWNRAAAAEKRVDAQEARILDFSMPRAIPRDLWVDAVRHIYEPFRGNGMALQIEVHDTLASDGGRNVNVHALLSLRRVDGEGFSRIKERAWNDFFREREGRAVRDLVAERLTAFCRDHGINYEGDARSNADRDLPAPEPELPGWNAEATKRTGNPTPAVADLHRHRQRRHAWQAGIAELAEAEAVRASLERAAREVFARRIEPVGGAAKMRARGDRRAAALRAWQGGCWIDEGDLGHVAKVRVDAERGCLWIDLTDGTILIDSGDVIRLRGPVTWAAADETAAAAERHGWAKVRVHGDQAYKDAVAVACALRGIPVVNHTMSPDAEATLKAKLAERLTAFAKAPLAARSGRTEEGSRTAYLRLLERRRGAPSQERSDTGDDLPTPGPAYRLGPVGGPTGGSESAIIADPWEPF